MEAVKKDKRFAHVLNDPRFRKLPKSERKVKIDQRFKSMFKDKQFKLKYSVDKRGRPVNLTTNENLRKFYELSSEEEEEEDSSSDEDENKIPDEMNKSDEEEDDSDSEEEKYESEEESEKPSPGSKSTKNGVSIPKEEKSSKATRSKEFEGVDSGIDFARGEGLVSSSSSEDEDEDEDEETGAEEKDFDHRWGENDDTVRDVQEATPRLAVCNMDWDRMKAHDIFVLLSSFKPAEGLVKSVKVYPSEFGLARMAEENELGPQELREMKETDAETIEGSKYHTEMLRQYQLNRLKYYYAVIECDSAETADKIYTQCDGIEYESSSNKLDLRFIPMDMEFDQTPTSVCAEQLDVTKYKPTLFCNTALSQSKVELTWDETDPDRLQKTQSVYSNEKGRKNKKQDVDFDDLQAYLASSSDEEDDTGALDLDQPNDEEDEGEESDEDVKIARYKNLMKELEIQEEGKDRKDVEMEISWEPGLKETTEDLIAKKQQTPTEQQTPWEDYLEKKKQKREKKRNEKKKKKKALSADEDTPSVDKDVEGMVNADSDDDNNDDSVPNEELEGESEGRPKGKKGKRKKKKPTDISPAEKEITDRSEAELQLLLMDEENTKKHFNMKKIIQNSSDKKKKKDKKSGKEKQDNFKVNVDDSRFSAIYESHHFNIDPSAPEFKRTEATDALISEKLDRRKKGDSLKRQSLNSSTGTGQNNGKDNKTKRHNVGGPSEDEPSSKRLMGSSSVSSGAAEVDSSLKSLVQSVKMKTRKFNLSKR